MTRHVHITIKKCLFLTLLIVGGALLSGCSKVGISDLSTLAGPGQSQAQLSSLKSFALIPLDHENPFSEQLALDAYWKQIGGTVMLPGTNRAADRFARVSFLISFFSAT